MHWLFVHSLLLGEGQSSAVRQLTHWPRVASHTLPVAEPAQSSLDRQPGVPPQTPPTQVTPVGQSSFARHCAHLPRTVSQRSPNGLHVMSEAHVTSGKVDPAVLAPPSPLPEPPLELLAPPEALAFPPADDPLPASPVCPPAPSAPVPCDLPQKHPRGTSARTELKMTALRTLGWDRCDWVIAVAPNCVYPYT